MAFLRRRWRGFRRRDLRPVPRPRKYHAWEREPAFRLFCRSRRRLQAGARRPGLLDLVLPDLAHALAEKTPVPLPGPSRARDVSSLLSFVIERPRIERRLPRPFYRQYLLAPG